MSHSPHELRPGRRPAPTAEASVQAPGAAEAASPGLELAQAVLGNAELLSTLDAPGAQAALSPVGLEIAGFDSQQLAPGRASVAAMRQVMRERQVDREGLRTDRAARVLSGGGGQRLPEAIRARVEAAFGHDFGHVRVHTDGSAAQAARDLNAIAFTTGADIYFSPGSFAPHTTEGQELLAHELTHVVQADEGRLPSSSGGLDVSSPSDPHEVEAVARGREVRQVLQSASRFGLETGFDAPAAQIDGPQPGARTQQPDAAAQAAPRTSTEHAPISREQGAQSMADQGQKSEAQRFAEAHAKVKIRGENTARKKNIQGHNVTFLLRTRKKLEEFLQQGRKDKQQANKGTGSATSGSQSDSLDMPKSGDKDGTGAATANNQPSLANVEIDEHASPTEATEALVDEAFIKLVMAYQTVKGGKVIDGWIGRTSYDNLVAQWPELAYETPEKVDSSEVGDERSVMSGLSPSQKYDQFKQVIEKNYGMFFTNPLYLNTVGLRGVKSAVETIKQEDGSEETQQTLTEVENQVGAWDDTVLALYVDDQGNKQATPYKATVDPNKLQGNNSNMMAEGQHLMKKGWHQGSRSSSYTAMNVVSEGKYMPGFRADAQGDPKLHLGNQASYPPYADNLHTTHASSGTKNVSGEQTRQFIGGTVRWQSVAEGGPSGNLSLLGLGGLWSRLEAAAQDKTALKIGGFSSRKAEEIELAGQSYRPAKISFSEGKHSVTEDIFLPPGEDGSSLAGKKVQISAATRGEQTHNETSTEKFSTPGGQDKDGSQGTEWSAGCQVIKGYDAYGDYMLLVEQAEANGQQTFPYTLISGDELVAELKKLASNKSEDSATKDAGGEATSSE